MRSASAIISATENTEKIQKLYDFRTEAMMYPRMHPPQINTYVVVGEETGHN